MRIRNLIRPLHLYRNRWRLSFRVEKTIARFLDTRGGTFAESVIEKVPFLDNQRRLVRLRDRHQGERCFIIGNGPSLRIGDLDLLKNEITFASNRIYLAFGQTDWRPSYYNVIDVMVADQYASSIKNLQLKKIFSSDIRFTMPFVDDVIWVYSLKKPNLDQENLVPLFSSDLRRGVYGGFTVVYFQLQIAFFMGFREIYLIGVDFKYEVPTPSGEISRYGPILVQQDQQNHFHPNYRAVGEKWTLPRLDIQYEAFRSANKAFELHNGKIFNASRSTELDVFPRVDFDHIVSG